MLDHAKNINFFVNNFRAYLVDIIRIISVSQDTHYMPDLDILNEINPVKQKYEFPYLHFKIIIFLVYKYTLVHSIVFGGYINTNYKSLDNKYIKNEK